jgi:hypothetical protein
MATDRPEGLASLGRARIGDLCTDDAIRNPNTRRWVRIIEKDDDGVQVTLKVRDIETNELDFFTRPLTTVFAVFA